MLRYAATVHTKEKIQSGHESCLSAKIDMLHARWSLSAKLYDRT